MNAKQIYEASYQDAITENQEVMYNWVKYRDEFKTTQGLVQTLPEKLSHRVMFPVGSKAFFPGKIVHTNEFLVGLGANYLVKKTAKQTNEYCDRRIKHCDAMLEKLEKEFEFLQSKRTAPDVNDAFGSEERPEINEHVTEEEDNAWREDHRRKVKEHHETLAKLRQQEKKIENEQDLWDRLEQLELEEELEDELNRLHDESVDEEEDDDDEAEDDNEMKLKSVGFADQNENEIELESSVKFEENPASVVKKKRIAFLDQNDDCSESGNIPDPLVLHFHHSTSIPKSQSTELTPADIVNQYSTRASPASILKVKANPHEERERAAAEAIDNKELKRPVEPTRYDVTDVVERNHSIQLQKFVKKAENRRMSKFKESRLK